MATKLAARERLAKTRNGSSGCATLDSTRKKSASRTAPPTRLAMVRRVAPAVRRVAGAGEPVDQGEQAARTGDGAGDVELAAVALGLVEEARGQQGRDDADRHVDQEGQAPAVLRVEQRDVQTGQPATQDQADGRTGTGHRGVHRERAVTGRAGRERGRDQRERRRRGERGTEALDASRGQQQGLALGEPAEQRGDREDRRGRA